MSVNPHIPASNFQINSKIESITPLGEGNIHETFIVKTSGNDSPDYLLQHKNKIVFRDVPSMMQNILAVSTHLKKKVEEKGKDPLRHSLNLIPARDNRLYYLDNEGEYWAMCLYIKNSATYRIPLNTGQVFEGGSGTGDFHNMLSDFSEPLTDILPGFHNIRYRYEQWDNVIANLSSNHKSQYSAEIEWIESRREEMMKFRGLFENGQIPLRVAHNDAKLLNILFDKQNNVLCLIDLDTVLYGSVLYDYGDAIRSYTNTGEEDDVNPENVGMKMDYFEAFTRGYIQEASAFLNQTEVESLAFAARYITFEQLLRFLMDYLDGNRYYRIAHPEHNMQRSRAQYALLVDMEKHYGEMVNRNFDIYRQYQK
jgi:Ser/Thr protein kinase RdoA (MazF antagonist)